MKTLENKNLRKFRIYNIFKYSSRDINKSRSNPYFVTLSKRFPSPYQKPFLNSAIEKKMKEVTLSLNSYNSYMNSYKKLTQTHTYKIPDVVYYPLTKNESFLPIAKKKYFSYQNLHDKSFKLHINIDNSISKSIRSKNISNLLNNRS